MAVSYDRLWHILIDKHWSKTKLIKEAKISTNAMAKMGKGQDVRVEKAPLGQTGVGTGDVHGPALERHRGVDVADARQRGDHAALVDIRVIYTVLPSVHIQPGERGQDLRTVHPGDDAHFPAQPVGVDDPPGFDIIRFFLIFHMKMNRYPPPVGGG